MSKTRKGKGARHHFKKLDADVKKKPSCNRPPTTPINLLYLWDHNHKRRHDRIRVALRWDEVHFDTSGFPLKLKHYDVELDYSVDNGATWISDLTGDTEDEAPNIERHKVPGKLDTDPNTRAHLVIHSVNRRLYYRYHVRAVGKDCTSAWSEWVVLGNPLDLKLPDAPTNVTIMRANNGLKLKWDVGPDEGVINDPDDVGIDITGFVAELHNNETMEDTLPFIAHGGTNRFECILQNGNQVSHGKTNGDPIQFFGGVPDPLEEGETYFVKNANEFDFQVALTAGGLVVNLTPVTRNPRCVGSGTLAARRKNIRQLSAKFNVDRRDGDATGKFYGRVDSKSDNGKVSEWIPATGGHGNSDPLATPTGRRPMNDRHVFTFTMNGDAVVKTYSPPDRAEDRYKVVRVSGDFDREPTGADLVIDILVGGDSIFDNDTAKMLRIAAGATAGNTDDIVFENVPNLSLIRVRVHQVGSSATGGDGTIRVVAERTGDRDAD